MKAVPLDDYGNYTFKQFQRTYGGEFAANFANALSGVVDTKTKNGSDTHLTNYMKLDDVVEIATKTTKPKNFRTSLKIGNKYLGFFEIDNTPYVENDIAREAQFYGAVCMTDTFDPYTTVFDITYVNEDYLTILYTNTRGEKFYLCSIESNTGTSVDRIAFVSLTKLDLESTDFEPYHFIYAYDESVNGLSLTKPDNYIIEVVGNEVRLPIMTNVSVDFLKSNTFILTRDVSDKDSNYNLNSSFTKYGGSSLFSDGSGGTYNLPNNFIIHRPFEDDRAAIIFNKNRIDENGYSYTTNTVNTFTNTLEENVFPNKREYCALFQDVVTESDDTLDLGYVVYDRAFEIQRGITTVQTPTSMYPYSKVDINDTSFAFTGAFYSDTPLYADKIRTDIDPTEDGYQYACTWLSGNFDGDVEWVDRYYYPNYTNKEDAIAQNSKMDVTYDDYVEQLIRDNESYQDEIKKYKIFDKKSDIEIVPNMTFTYERFNFEDVATYPDCSDLLDYYKQINNTNEITVDFIFNGDDTPWEMKTARNKIDSGITFTKNTQTKQIDFVFKVYRGFVDSFETYSVSAPYNRFGDNIVAFTFNGRNGLGYVLLNNTIVLSIKTSPYRYGQDRLMQGDFLYNGTFFTSYNDQISRFYINNESITKSRMVVLPFIRNVSEVNPMSIYIPCGQVNRVDKVSMLHTLCENKSSKSNMVDINIGNLQFTDETLLSSLSGVIMNTFNDYAPVGTQLNQINFKNID